MLIKRGKWERKAARAARRVDAAPAETAIAAESPIEEPIETAPPVKTTVISDQQRALAQIAKYVQSSDWGRVRATAKKAAEQGHLTDDEISDAIDAALPSTDDVGKLPLHHAIAVVSAASPERRSGYASIFQQHPALTQLPPDAQAQINDHMRLIGLNA